MIKIVFSTDIKKCTSCGNKLRFYRSYNRTVKSLEGEFIAVLSSLDDRDDTYDADTLTSNDFTTLLTLLVETPLKYDSSITDSTAFSTLE